MLVEISVLGKNRTRWGRFGRAVEVMLCKLVCYTFHNKTFIDLVAYTREIYFLTCVQPGV